MPGSQRFFLVAALVVPLTAVPGAAYVQQLPPQVTPHSGTAKTASNVTGRTVTFSVLNQGPNDESFTLTCTRSGAVSACAAPSSSLIAAGLSKNISVSYSTGAPQLGTLALKATGSGGSDSGHFNITVQDSTGPTSSSITIDATPQNGDYIDVTKCVANCFDVSVGYSTPAYMSLDLPRSITLAYRGAQAKKVGLIQVNATDTSTNQPVKMSILLKRSDGTFVTFTNGSTEIFFGTGTGANRLAAQFDASTFATGAYKYTVVARSWFSDGSFKEATAPIRILIVNETSSPFGWGWSIAGLQKLYFQSDGSVVVAEGNGSAAVFPLDLCPSGCTYSSPPGDFSTFSSRSTWPDNVKYDRRYPDGTALAYYSDGRLATVKDRFGNTTQYGYDGSNRLNTITDPAGRPIWLYYGANALLDSVKDEAGRTTHITTDASSNLTEVWDAAGVRALALTYDANHRVQASTDRRGDTWNLSYDFAGKLAADTFPSIIADGVNIRPIVRYQSLEAAELVDPGSGFGSSVNPAPRVIPSNLRESLVNPRGFATGFLVDRFGAPLRVEEPMGRVRTYNRDVNSLVLRTASPNGHVWNNTWSGPNLVQSIDSTTQQVINYTYEANYHEVTQIRGNADSVWNYWSAGKLDSTRTGTSLQPVAKFTYDSRGRVLTRTDAGGHVISYNYNTGQSMNLASRVLGASGSVTFSYDTCGRVATLTDATNKITTFRYDSLNRQTQRVGPLSDTTRYLYDSLYLRQFIDPKGQSYLFAHNALGWLGTRTDPNGVQDQYSYDRDGSVTQWTNRRGQSVAFAYDSLDILRSVATGTDTTRYFADPAERFIAGSNAESTDTIKFDSGGRIQSQISLRSGTRYEVQTSYESRGLPSALIVVSPWSATVSYHYNPFVMLDTLTDWSGGKTTIQYDSDRLPDTLTLPTGQKITGRFPSSHTAGELTFVNNALLNQKIGAKYGYNDLGQVTDRYTGDMFGGREYRYDAVGRDTAYLDYFLNCSGTDLWDANHAWYCSVPPTKTYQSDQEHYQFDNVGNRTDLAAATVLGNRLIRFNGDSLVYDADGNLTSRIRSGQIVQRLYWNTVGQLIAVWTSGADSVSMAYDAFGRRARKSTVHGTSRYIWNNNNLLAELDGSGNRLAEYTYYPGIDQPNSERRGSNTYYYVQDFPGNILGLLDVSNTLVNQYKYKPFGADDGSPAPSVSNSLRFAARELDPETGFYYIRARYYDPQLGRFISEDPIGLGGGINQYQFGDDNPVSESDPSGLCPPCAALVGAGVGGLFYLGKTYFSGHFKENFSLKGLAAYTLGGALIGATFGAAGEAGLLEPVIAEAKTVGTAARLGVQIFVGTSEAVASAGVNDIAAGVNRGDSFFGPGSGMNHPPSGVAGGGDGSGGGVGDGGEGGSTYVCDVQSWEEVHSSTGSVIVYIQCKGGGTITMHFH